MSIVLVGSTSGSVTLQEPAIAGSTVLTLPAVSGTVLTTGSSGQSIPKAALPTGSILQVVQAEYSTSTSTTSGTFTDSGLTASITPTSSTSKILVLINQQIRVNKSGAADTGYGLRILRGATAIFSRDDSATAQYYTTQAGTSADLRFPNTMIYLDSPATTSSTTYKTQINSFNTSTVAAQHGSQPSTITLMEIAA
jgi:hypothetical protein